MVVWGLFFCGGCYCNVSVDIINNEIVLLFFLTRIFSSVPECEGIFFPNK